MIELIGGAILGGVISWVITRYYYKKSSVKAPEWAKPLIEKLPEVTPSLEELTALFQKEINKGTIKPHPVFQHVACPNCNAPLDKLKERIMGDDYTTILEISCPNCGWNDWAEV
ncbi:MAG TPA: hypothetical protein ENI34_08540 [candidate division WOR-3 bacterium]|uniref:Uncharacterized protein n=1 Tax=candidate division WOR-3 bacterium TaxID=2052148 RepID=A0A9C9ENG4_UNCW3|nr:hypothetical protein [candidate division WOR-3 bacterium]